MLLTEEYRIRPRAGACHKLVKSQSKGRAPEEVKYRLPLCVQIDRSSCKSSITSMEHWTIDTASETTEILGGKKPASVPLCPPQISHGLTWDRIQASAVRCRRLAPRARNLIKSYSCGFLKETCKLGCFVVWKYKVVQT